MIKEGLNKLKNREVLTALKIFKKLHELDPNDGDILFFLGNIYYELNDLKKSLFYLKKSLEKYPNSEAIINNYAITLQSLGKIDKAKELFENLIKSNTNNIKAYFRLFRMNLKNFEEKYLDKIKLIEKEQNLKLEDKSLINYIYAKYEKKKSMNNEIKFLNLSHEYQFNSRLKYNSRSVEYHTEVLMNNFNNIKLIDKNKKLINNNKKKPVFIIGLPRSGSTLIESFLMQNKKEFYSYGESSIFDTSIFNQINKNFDKNYKNKNFKIYIDKENLIYSLENIYSYSENIYFIDKSLENFFYIDIILQIYPEAKFIHTFRNRFDAALAIYNSMLIYLPWTHSIDNIIKYILTYEKIISFFKKKYPEKILNVGLENFTTETHEQLKRIFDFCDIDWNSNILKSYNSKNLASKTSSFLQVREKIKKYEANKYKPYYFLIENKF